MKARTISMVTMLSIVVLSAMMALPVSAETAATRDLPDACVDAGAQFDVTVDVSDCAMGQLTETLCGGWTYVDGSATSTGAGGVTASTSGNDLTLTFFSVSQVAYKVQAPGQEGECCGITGVLDDNSQTYAVGGETQDVCTCTGVAGPETSATRDLPDACVDAGAQFDVTVDVSDCAMGQLTETLCGGWTYVDGSATSTGAGGVTASTSGNDLTLTFFSVSQVAYKVQAPGQEGECCGITGVLDDNSQTYAVGGETQNVCTCTSIGSEPSATRDLPDACVDVGAQFDVTVDVSDCAMGQLTETLCGGWTYVDGSATSTGAGGVTASTSGNDLTLTFFSVSQVAYKVQAPGQEGECCGITGVLDDNTQTYVVGGETQDVCTCTPCACDFCIDLDAGWNLVSVPRMLDGQTDAATVFNLGATELCEYYDGCAGEWSTAAPSAMQVIPGRGYMVSKANAETLCLNFDDSGTAIPLSQQLCADDWNMIGFPSLDSMSVAEFGAVTALDGKFTMVWQWNSGWECVSPPDSNSMIPGKGYLLWMTDDGVLPGMIAIA